MNRDEVLSILRQHQNDLERLFGVSSLVLFGSVARNENHPGSDVDLLVDFNRPVGYFGLLALQDHLEKLLSCSVDLGTPNSIKPRMKDAILEDAIHVA